MQAQKFRICGYSGPGQAREVNEDNLSVNGVSRRTDRSKILFEFDRPQPLLCAVYDGMGGEEGGVLASKLCARESAELYKKLSLCCEANLDAVVRRHLEDCSQRIRDEFAGRGFDRGGTTVAMAVTIGEGFHLFNIGDSRIYLWSEGSLKRISKDHTLAQKRIDMNILSEEEAAASPQQHMLTRFIGIDKGESAQKEVDIFPPVSLKPGEKLLLCTDGLYDMCPEEQMEYLLGNTEGLKETVQRMAAAAFRRGALDNLTCILIEGIFDDETEENKDDEIKENKDGETEGNNDDEAEE